MGEITAIEWTDHTFNPWEGCTKVSAGCAHCYAATRNKRFNNGVATNWGPGAPRRRTSPANWTQPLKWNAEAGFSADVVRAAGAKVQRPRVFCASLADWLDDEVPIEWLVDLLRFVRVCRNLDWQLLTKRPQNFIPRLTRAMKWIEDKDRPISVELHEWILDWVMGMPPYNVWVGTSVEDDENAGKRIPALVMIPAKIRFLSMEPLLGPVEIGSYTDPIDGGYVGKSFIDWVIVGGESGPGARPMNPNWVRSIQEECADAGVPFFFKQWGEWAAAVETNETVTITSSAPGGKKNPDWFRFADGQLMGRIGKKAAGRILDGKTYSEFPQS